MTGMKSLWIPTLLFCASCSGPQPISFRVAAINTDEEEVPCAILIDDQVVVDNGTNEPIRTPAQIPIEFPEAKDGGEGRAGVKLGVRAVALDPQGKVLTGLKEGESSPYTEDSRFVYPDDGRSQLFILRRNKEAGG